LCSGYKLPLDIADLRLRRDSDIIKRMRSSA
jgi:hypothetical protein